MASDSDAVKPRCVFARTVASVSSPAGSIIASHAEPAVGRWRYGCHHSAARKATRPLHPNNFSNSVGSVRGGTIRSILWMIRITAGSFLFSAGMKSIRAAELGVAALAVMVLLLLYLYWQQYRLSRQLLRQWKESRRNSETLRRLLARLLLAEKISVLSHVVSGAAHEINNPLTAIIGYADLLGEDPAVAPETKKFATKIGQQARRVREVIAGLRSFVKPTPDQRKPLDVNALLTSAIELCSLDQDSDHIRIERNLARDLPSVNGEENRLLQLWFHIVGNALDALRQIGGGVLRVRSRSEAGKVLIEFADNGPGVSNLQRIFDPFYSTKPAGRALGLGLTTCTRIVQDHGGRIVGENLSSGGAKFTVTLPAAVSAQSPDEKAAAVLVG